ncbi:MAG TPA: hypothetical protein VG860_08300 [Terriglobia bacterium]|nr:hypothetical protein [Terriglobia bacterium]
MERRQKAPPKQRLFVLEYLKDEGLERDRRCDPGRLFTPNDFPDLAAVADRLLKFQSYYESIAKPFEWRFNPPGPSTTPEQGGTGCRMNRKIRDRTYETTD